ncbi:hypothetical protein R1sor_000999 [Riccia sorocarpa]|uniref:CrcB-like protein n=1 Tax=Riccia sorocarpa TaxID=122646 RepID=A0ABD3GX59_9MARC
MGESMMNAQIFTSNDEDEREGMSGDMGSARNLDALDSVGRSFSAKCQSQRLVDSSGRMGGSTENAQAVTLNGEHELEGMAGDTASSRHFGLDSLERSSSARSQSLRRVGSAQVAPLSSSHGLDRVSRWLEFFSILAHLTTFGIIGVLIRYGLESLFGPPVAGVTSNNGALFNDLPANMLGSFFMGWVGVVFKKNISVFSEHLAVGLSTGLMGSITTYAAMIQRMVANMVGGRWMNGISGLVLGMELAQISLIIGVDSAKLICKILERINHNRDRRGLKPLQAPSPDNAHRRNCSLLIFTLVGGCLWVGSLVLTIIDRSSISRRTLWLACVVAPPGVWMRWYFARLNGQGIGQKHLMRWLPVGTLLVNVVASSMEAGLATVEAAVGNYNSRLWIESLQLGMFGCLSTVSTFVAEIQTMHQGKNRWRAYVYPLSTIITSVVIGLLIYGIPVWVLGLDARYRPLGETGTN